MEYEFPLIDKKEVAEGTMQFTLDTSGSDFKYKAGQNADYILINPPYQDPEGNKRTFSIVCPPGENKLMFATRMRNTAFKNSLKEMPLGTKIKVDGPYGQFTLHKDTSKPAAFLAGGIGITPFMAMLGDITKNNFEHTIYLFYSNRTRSLMTYFEELEQYKQSNPRFTFIPTLTDETPENWTYETGKLTMDMIKKYIPDVSNTIFYTAGPAAMVQAMMAMLELGGIPEEHLKAEDFPGY